MQSKPLPPATVARLERLLTERQAIQAVIDATVVTVKEALGVPDEWTLQDLRVGFVGPTEQNEEA